MYYKFIDEYVPKASPTYSLIYLYALRYASQGLQTLTINDIAAALHLIPSDVNGAILFWVSQGLMSLDGDEVFITKLPKTAPELPVDEVFSDLVQHVQASFGGTLSSTDLHSLVWMYKELKLNPYVIDLVVSNLRQGKNPKSMKYIEKIAYTIHEENIDTIKKAEEFLADLKERAKSKKARDESASSGKKAKSAKAAMITRELPADGETLSDKVFREMFEGN
jgi:DNA replication protein DnaD